MSSLQRCSTVLHPSNVQVTSKLHFSSGEVTHKSRYYAYVLVCKGPHSLVKGVPLYCMYICVKVCKGPHSLYSTVLYATRCTYVLRCVRVPTHGIPLYCMLYIHTVLLGVHMC